MFCGRFKHYFKFNRTLPDQVYAWCQRQMICNDLLSWFDTVNQIVLSPPPPLTSKGKKIPYNFPF